MPEKKAPLRSATSTPESPAFQILGPDGQPLAVTRIEDGGVYYFTISIPNTGSFAIPGTIVIKKPEHK